MTQIALAHFDDFLAVARQQPAGERLLLVFTRKELPAEHTEEQAREFEAGTGGHLAPLACVHKTPNELRDFEQLAVEARGLFDDWHAVFAAALACDDRGEPNEAVIDEALQEMLQNIREGFTANYLVFDPFGSPLQLSTLNTG